MRIEAQGQSIETPTSSKSIITNKKIQKQIIIEDQKIRNEDQVILQEKMHQVVDSMNKIFDINNKNLKFVYHDGLKEYFVQLVNTETDEVVKEIPPKRLLDAYYEMQKLVGMIIDEKR